MKAVLTAVSANLIVPTPAPSKNVSVLGNNIAAMAAIHSYTELPSPNTLSKVSVTHDTIEPTTSTVLSKATLRAGICVS